MNSTPTPAVLASLRSADLECLDEELASLNVAQVQGLHLDVMDGVWVDETCFSIEFCQKVRQKTTLMVDVHLMVEDPQKWIPGMLEAGADRVSVHLEAVDDPGPLLAAIRAAGKKAGLVVLPGTPIDAVHPWLDQVDLVNPLGVDPRAKSGFQESTYARIAELCACRERRGLHFAVQADGGVWEKTRDGLVAAGADELVGGYPIFSSDDYREAVRRLREGENGGAANGDVA